jgi:hypothetical protein
MAPAATTAPLKADVTTAITPAVVKSTTPAIDVPARPDPTAVQAEAAQLAAERTAADAAKAAAEKAASDAARLAAAKAAATRKLVEDRRRREEAERLALLAEVQRKRDEDNKRLAEEQRKRDEENKRLAREKAERERIAAEQAAAAGLITGIASALFANKQKNRR